jgi:hypothetical protein
VHTQPNQAPPNQAPPDHAQPDQAQPAHGRAARAGDSSGKGRLVTAAIAGALAVLTAVLWLTGGLKSQPSGPQKVAPGSAFDQGRFTVTVRDARISVQKVTLGDKQERLLIVRMHIANNDTKTASLFTDFGTAFTGVPKPGTYLQPREINGVAFGEKTFDVQPGLPVDAEAVWPLPANASPRQMTVALRQWDFGPGFTRLEKEWTATRTSPVIATVTMPVVGP